MTKRINELEKGERFTYKGGTYTYEYELTVRGHASQYMCKPEAACDRMGANAIARPFMGNLEVEIAEYER